MILEGGAAQGARSSLDMSRVKEPLDGGGGRPARPRRREGEVGVGQLEKMSPGDWASSPAAASRRPHSRTGCGPGGAGCCGDTGGTTPAGLLPVKLLQRLVGKAQKPGPSKAVARDSPHTGWVIRPTLAWYSGTRVSLIAPALGVVHQPDQKLATSLLQGQKS